VRTQRAQAAQVRRVWALVAVVSLRYAGGLIARYGPARTLLSGLALVAAGLLLFAHAPADGPYLRSMLPVMAVLGTGVGLAFPAVMALAMSRATEQDAGLASGLINTTVQAAGALGLAVLASLATSHANQLRRAGDPPLRALASGYRLAAVAGAGLVLAALAVTCVLLILTRRQRLVTAHQHPDRKIRTLHPPASSQ
jgi:MFS family permease